MIVYDSFAVADTVSAANGGTFSGNMAMVAHLLSPMMRICSGTLFVDAVQTGSGLATSPSQLLSIFDSGNARME